VDARDYVARVVWTGTSGAVAARVVGGDQKLELRLRGAHTVLVRGYGGEPFLRFSTGGVQVNRRSLTAVTLALVDRSAEPALGEGAAPRWQPLASGTRYAWHDHRLGHVPGRAYAQGRVGRWTIPLVVDGRPDRLAGDLWHASGPPLWPWLAALAAAAAAGLALSRAPRRLALPAAVAAAVTAAGAALLTSVALGFAPGAPAGGAWAGAAISAALAAGALAALLLARRLRDLVAGIVSLFAGLAGLGHAGVLVHGYVLAALPGGVVRASTAVAVAAGAIGAASLLRPGVLRLPERRRPAGRVAGATRGRGGR
jgi:hypothetical protein